MSWSIVILIAVNMESIRFIAGEPLLRERLSGMAKIARNYFPDPITSPQIFTNKRLAAPRGS
jgi:molybdenum cofactor biosynthesis enzyme MoaA